MRGTPTLPFWISLMAAQAVSAPSLYAAPLAFPGAVGFGVDSPAGRGGKVIRVTTLASDGPGSLRDALDVPGPRIVVFEVGGVINLEKRTLEISEPFLTVAGETAPSPGITIIRGGITVTTHDVLIRHIRVRPGDADQAALSGWEPDGLTTSGGDAYNVIVDHCSFTWAVDENLSASGPRTDGPDATSHRVTFSNCIIAEALSHASHRSGEHSKGTLIHDFCRDIAIIGNLYAHNANRNPYFKGRTTGVIVNNVIYNPRSAAIRLDYVPSEWQKSEHNPANCRVAIVGNVLLHGIDTSPQLALVARRGDAFLEDNLAFDREGNPAPLVDGEIAELAEKPVWPDGLEPVPAADTLEHVIRHAGARPRERDAVDRRIIEDFQSRKGRIIDSQNEVGGYPVMKMTRRPLEIPEENVDTWLENFGAEVE